MRNRTIIIIIAILAIVLWVGMIFFMNKKAPDTTNQTMFLLIWCITWLCTVIPLSYVIQARLNPLTGVRNLGRAVRQGLIASILATTLMALRFLRLLSLPTGIILLLLALVLEVLISLKR